MIVETEVIVSILHLVKKGVEMKSFKIYLDRKVNINQGSSFQGFLMEQISYDYATKLHLESLRPYSQYLANEGECGVWYINLYDKDAEENFTSVLDDIKEISITKNEETYKVSSIELKEDNATELFARALTENNSRYVSLKFITPTAFKQNEQYYYFPDIKLIFQSIINKNNSFVQDSMLDDETFLMPIVNESYICDYKIMTKNYYIEKTHIKGFVGNIMIKINGPMPLVNLAHFVLRYGTYTGVGIKTAMGMGGLKLLK